VAILNDLGGTVPGATSSISIALSTNPGGATLGGTTTVAALDGIATFSNLSLDRAGTGYTLAASSAGLTPTTSLAFSNVAGPARQLTLTTPTPASATSGLPLSPQPSLQLRDEFGNAVGQPGVAVAVAVNSGSATLGGGTSASTNAAGVATFSALSLTGTVGTITLTFSAPGLTSVSSPPIILSSAAAATLALVTQPSAAAQSGVPLAVQPEVRLRDAAGNNVNTAGVTITASLGSGPAGAVLGGGTTVPTGANGMASFTNLVITGPAGSYALRFSSGSLAPVTSNAIVVTVGQPSRLTITTQPSGTAANGAPFAQQPVIQLRDASGNPVGVSGVAVTASIASGGGTLGGTVTSSTDGSGAARFTNLSISGTVGSRTLAFSSSGLLGVTSGTVAITAGPATHLSITVEPSTAASAGVPFPQQPVVQLRDSHNNPVPTSGVAVSVAVSFGVGSGALAGTLTVSSNASGFATFTNLLITGPGMYTLRFTSGSLGDVVSLGIIVI
jgi:hypothetical protein